MVLIGNIIPLRATISHTTVHINIDTPPQSIVAGIRMRLSAVRKVMRARCGMARPIKPIGPQKAVTVPANSVVDRKMMMRERVRLRPIVSAYASPKSRMLSGFIATTASIKPAITIGTRTYSCSIVTVATEPMVQTTNDLSDSSVPIYWRMPTTAEIAEDSIIPTISITLIFRILRDNNITRSSISAEPIHAIPVMPNILSHDDVAMPSIGAASVKSATPRLAPELMPRTYGPARGLRKRVCICRPLAERAIPAAMATITFGSRILSTMVAWLASAALPISAAHTSLAGSAVVPIRRSHTANATRAMPSRMNSAGRSILCDLVILI